MITLIKTLEKVRTDYPISVAEMPSAYEYFDEVLDEGEKQELVDALAFGPECGEPIPGTQNRLREYCYCFGNGTNKRQIKVIYFFYDLNMPLYVIAAFDAKTKITITDRETKTMMELTDKIIAEYSQKNIGLMLSQKSTA